jgi:hypothetical protein
LSYDIYGLFYCSSYFYSSDNFISNVTLTTDADEVIARIEVARAVEETIDIIGEGDAATPEGQQDDTSE